MSDQKVSFKGIVITLQIWMILIDRLSHPWALVGSTGFIIDSISFSEMLNDFILVFFLYEKDNKVLAFFIGVHIDAKKLLKMFDFS